MKKIVSLPFLFRGEKSENLFSRIKWRTFDTLIYVETFLAKEK